MFDKKDRLALTMSLSYIENKKNDYHDTRHNKEKNYRRHSRMREDSQHFVPLNNIE